MNLENTKEDKGVYYYDVKGFATILIEFRFLMSNDKKHVIIASLLSMYLKRVNSKYGSWKDIKDKLKDFYNMSINISHDKVGSKRFFTAQIELLNQNIINENYFEEAINFAKDILLSPKFDGDKLDLEVAKQIKKDIIDSQIISLSNPSIYSSRKLLKEAIEPCNINQNIYLDIEEFKQIVDSVTDEEVIDFYNEVMNNFYRGLVFGDVSLEQYSIIKNCFPFKSRSEVLDYSEKTLVRNGELTIEDSNIKDSTLDVVYQINNYSLDKWYLYRIIGVMLSHSKGLCHGVLRSEMGLVYSAGSYINKYRFNGIIIIEAKIDKDNKDKCLDGISEIFKRLRDENVVNDLLEFVKDKFNQDDMVSDESVNNLISELEDYVYNERPTREELHKITNNVSVKDIINAVNDIEEKFVYFYRGIKDEK